MRTRRVLPLALAMVLLTCAGAIFLAALGIDAIEGRSEFQFFADSSTYHELARGTLLGVDGPGDLITIAANFLGPLMVLRLAGENYYAVLLINAVLMFLSIASISKTLRLDALRMGALLFCNPLTVSSLLSVNKEVLSLVFAALLLRALAERSAVLLVVAAAVALLVRWQLTLVLVVVTVLMALARPAGHRRRILFVGLLLALSALYVALLPIFEPVRATFELSASEYEGSGLYEWLVGMQESGSYWLVFPLKAAHLLFGMGLRFDRLVAPSSIYNDVWQLLHSTATLVIFLALWRRRRVAFNNDLVFISAIYIAVFALSPIYSPRYFYVVYVLWAAALASPARLVQFPRSAPRRRPAPATAFNAHGGKPTLQAR